MAENTLEDPGIKWPRKSQTVRDVTLGYSQTYQKNVLAQKPNAFHLGQYASANLLWAPIPKFLTGVELLWGRLEDFNGGSANDHRIQFTARYNYDISFRPSF